jgi:hypothetical protein
MYLIKKLLAKTLLGTKVGWGFIRFNKSSPMICRTRVRRNGVAIKTQSLATKKSEVFKLRILQVIF